jgi:hypothetical protein
VLIRALARAGGAGRCRGVIIAWGADQQRISILITKLTVLTKDEPCASRVELSSILLDSTFQLVHSLLQNASQSYPSLLRCCSVIVSDSRFHPFWDQ